MTSRRAGQTKLTTHPPAPREEAEILEDIKALCREPGFAQAVALACTRDDVIFYRDEVTAQDMRPMYARSRLIRTEVSTLIGYMVQAGDAPYQQPVREPLAILEDAERLLEELHRRLSGRWFVDLPAAIEGEDGLAPMRGDAMREPIFYGGEAALSFQYLDLAILKYRSDNDWMLAHRGFRIEDAVAVAKAINDRVLEGIEASRRHCEVGDISRFSLADPYCFSAPEIADRSGMEASIVEKILDAFALPEGACNFGFQALGDFNEVNARPLIRHDGHYLSFKYYALLEAIYESPFYWMNQDKAYRPTADANRGQFAETFAFGRLVSVFGPEHVWRNVNLYRGKDRLGEIDVLVTIGGRAIVVQCKSKRLTLEARKGNDLALSKDFHGAFQHAYDQAQLCAECLVDQSVRLVTGDGGNVILPNPITRTLPLCLVADNYPALAMQVDRFLKSRDVPKVLPALFTDLFALDAMTEMLDRPLYFLNYLELRARFGEKMNFSHEMTPLSFHLKHNLWLSDEYQGVMLDDDFAADLEIAMLARRVGIPGAKTPKGILTAMVGTRFDFLIRRAEEGNDPALVDLGMLLLQVSGAAARAFSEAIEDVIGRTRADRRLHDASFAFPPAGITIHSSYEPLRGAVEKLEAHCRLRKYDTKSEIWHGLWLNPADGLPHFGLKLEYPWVADPVVARAVMNMRSSGQQLGPSGRLLAKPKIGRNDPCPCGSGKKYKRCCLDGT